MITRKLIVPPETFTSRSNLAGEAAEAMAQAKIGDLEARATYSRLLVQQSKSFGDYIRRKVGTGSFKKTA